ncbi:MAG: hypothetical protein ACI87X_001229, partial [Candidatus Arcticimaribacter sp.]
HNKCFNSFGGILFNHNENFTVYSKKECPFCGSTI